LLKETIDLLKKDNEGLQGQLDHQFTEVLALKKQDEEFDNFLKDLKRETISRAEDAKENID
jgi:hypothetical protein